MNKGPRVLVFELHNSLPENLLILPAQSPEN
jgi:hypothetical protein